MNILHFQVPLLDNGRVDNLAIRPETLGKFLQLIKNRVGDDYAVVASPCVPSLLDYKGDLLYNFDMKQITVNDLISMINDGQEKS